LLAEGKLREREEAEHGKGEEMRRPESLALARLVGHKRQLVPRFLESGNCKGVGEVQQSKIGKTNPTPLPFLQVRILKKLQAEFVEVRILKELRTDNFGQNRAKRGVCS
jgi:hypothetical protein